MENFTIFFLTFISNIFIVIPDFCSYFNQYCGKSFILKIWPIANSYEEGTLRRIWYVQELDSTHVPEI